MDRKWNFIKTVLFFCTLLINLLNNTIFAAEISLLKSYEVKMGSLDQAYFDSSQQLHILPMPMGELPALKSICTTHDNIESSPSRAVYLLAPRVDLQRCLPNAHYPHGFNLLVRLKNQAQAEWSYLIAPTSDGSFNTNVIGASAEAIILYDLAKGSFTIIAPENGKVLYPLPHDPAVKILDVNLATWDPQRQLLYLVTVYYTEEKPSQIYQLNLKTGSSILLATLPNQHLSQVHALPIQLLLTSDGQYLAVSYYHPSRLYAGGGLKILDINTKQWIFQKHRVGKWVLGPHNDLAFIISNPNNIAQVYPVLIKP